MKNKNKNDWSQSSLEPVTIRSTERTLPIHRAVFWSESKNSVLFSVLLYIWAAAWQNHQNDLDIWSIGIILSRLFTYGIKRFSHDMAHWYLPNLCQLMSNTGRKDDSKKSGTSKNIWLFLKTSEPRHEKICRRGLRPGKTNTGLHSHRS